MSITLSAEDSRKNLYRFFKKVIIVTKKRTIATKSPGSSYPFRASTERAEDPSWAPEYP